MDEKTAAELRAPFPPELVGKRPQVTCRKCTDARFKVCEDHRKQRCGECGAYVTVAHTHLDFVGHADITDRYLQVDPDWNWEPVARDIDPQLLAAAIATGNADIVNAVIQSAPPKFDNNGGLWMRLTIGGVTRLGYGDAQGKSGPNAIKEAIGDGLRNAGMRFGAGLDMWRKESPDSGDGPQQRGPQPPARQQTDHEWLSGMETRICAASSDQELLTLANEIDAKRLAGAVEPVHYDHLWALGEQRLNVVKAAVDEVPPAEDRPGGQSPQPSPTNGASGQGYAARIAAAPDLAALDAIKSEVMAAFKGGQIDPTAGNNLLRSIKARQSELEGAAA